MEVKVKEVLDFEKFIRWGIYIPHRDKLRNLEKSKNKNKINKIVHNDSGKGE
jgi:hypothetical protein